MECDRRWPWILLRLVQWQDTYPRAQYFSYAPRLSDAAARCEWSLSVEDLADRSDARIVEMRHEALERMARAGDIVRIDLEPRVNERPDQPAPAGALVIRSVTRAKVDQ